MRFDKYIISIKKRIGVDLKICQIGLLIVKTSNDSMGDTHITVKGSVKYGL